MGSGGSFTYLWELSVGRMIGSGMVLLALTDDVGDNLNLALFVRSRHFKVELGYLSNERFNV